MKEALGDRMKTFYENRTRILLPRKTYTLIRIDGKAFHTYTKGLQKPFDLGLMEDMNETAAYLCKNIQGAKFAYVQSDEISILVTDFDDIMTDMWFDGNVQKIVSVSASLATTRFNQLRMCRIINPEFDYSGSGVIEILNRPQATFDARVFTIPQSVEVENYFIWRQQDAVRNSIASVAQSLYSHKELNGKTSNEQQEMIFQKGIIWNDYASREKRGGFIERVTYLQDAIQHFPKENKVGPIYFLEEGIPLFEDKTCESKVTTRKKWETVECPIFTQERDFLKTRISQFSENVTI